MTMAERIDYLDDPAAPKANSVPNGIIHVRDTCKRSATAFTDSEPTKFKKAA